MSSNLPDSERRHQAEELIMKARALLTGEAEEIAAIYLDHAVSALHDVESDLEAELEFSATKVPGLDLG